ncbi:hypothetical protein ACFV0T_36815 [Streptomyces sp. NPDC059582]|uniref:hypothetical protein n=1 Tax=Streptomyces sp. NPDC059582 TaxID=3346875 RepID=UPI0036B7B4AE
MTDSFVTGTLDRARVIDPSTAVMRSYAAQIPGDLGAVIEIPSPSGTVRVGRLPPDRDPGTDLRHARSDPPCGSGSGQDATDVLAERSDH